MLTYMKAQLQNSVHEHRLDQKLTQQQLADAVGVTRQTIIAIEKGNYTPSVALAIAISNTFNATVEDIFFLASYEK